MNEHGWQVYVGVVWSSEPDVSKTCQFERHTRMYNDMTESPANWSTFGDINSFDPKYAQVDQFTKYKM